MSSCDSTSLSVFWIIALQPGAQQYLIVLICSFLITWCWVCFHAYFSSAYLLKWYVCSGLLPIFKSGLFYSTEDWTQGLPNWATSLALFKFFILIQGLAKLPSCPGWVQACSCPDSALPSAGIIGVPILPQVVLLLLSSSSAYQLFPQSVTVILKPQGHLDFFMYYLLGVL